MNRWRKWDRSTRSYQGTEAPIFSLFSLEAILPDTISYIWSGVLDTDAFQAFKETDLFNPEKAQAFRKEILERGGTVEPMDMYVNFRGAEPGIDALLKKRGLDEASLPMKK